MEHIFCRIIDLFTRVFSFSLEVRLYAVMFQSGIKVSLQSEPAFSFRFVDKYSAAPVVLFLFNASSEANHKEPRLQNRDRKTFVGSVVTKRISYVIYNFHLMKNYKNRLGLKYFYYE
jgi:hypothetical protein